MYMYMPAVNAIISECTPVIHIPFFSLLFMSSNATYVSSPCNIFNGSMCLVLWTGVHIWQVIQYI